MTRVYTKHDAHGYRNGMGPCVCEECEEKRDEARMAPADPLDAARGIVLGLVIGIPMIVVLAIVLALVRS